MAETPCSDSLGRAKSINAWLVAIILKGLPPTTFKEGMKVEPYIFVLLRWERGERKEKTEKESSRIRGHEGEDRQGSLYCYHDPIVTYVGTTNA